MKKYNIFKTDVSKYNVNNPYEKYLLRLNLARDINEYVQKLALESSKQTLETEKISKKCSKRF